MRITRRAMVSMLAVLAAGALALRAQATDSLLFIGGGATPHDSQVSIESNVIWIDGLLRKRGFTAHQLLFTSGQENTPDVVLHAPEDPQVQRWLPLARIQGEQHAGVSLFRRNRITAQRGAATAEAVNSALGRALQSLGRGDGLLILYNGHGSWGEPDATSNALRLWGETQLDVAQFAELLKSRAEGTQVRYIMPQCYSGAFARSLFRDPRHPRATEVLPGQCGFFSVSEDHEAEGCTPGVDAGEYRDYSTYFFAALAGATRLGAPLARDADLDGDGKVTLGEAHDYAYTEGLSTDLPFATSEYFLEVWQPWYVRWQSAIRPGADNPYLRRALRLAEVLGLEARDPAALARETLTKRGELQGKIDLANQRIAELAHSEEALRKRMLDEFQLHWPAARQPFSHAFMALIESQGEALLGWIRAQADFRELERLQLELDQADLALLDLQRRASGHARTHRMLKLAAIRAHFDRLASPQARSTYESLLQCEAWSLPDERAPGG